MNWQSGCRWFLQNHEDELKWLMEADWLLYSVNNLFLKREKDKSAKQNWFTKMTFSKGFQFKPTGEPENQETDDDHDDPNILVCVFSCTEQAEQTLWRWTERGGDRNVVLWFFLQCSSFLPFLWIHIEIKNAFIKRVLTQSHFNHAWI